MTSAPATKEAEDKAAFEQSMKALESQVANVGAHVTIDSTTRLAYAREIKAMAKKLESDALSGKIGWAEAAKQTQEAGKEIVSVGAGIGGGAAGGALAGLACGPRAPICVTVGAFVGGTLAAFGISFVW